MDREDLARHNSSTESTVDGLQRKTLEPYALPFSRTCLVEDIVSRPEEFVGKEIVVKMAGRIMALRRHGKATFADLQDRSGRIQTYLKQDTVGEEAYQTFQQLDVGDLIGVEGRVFRTRTQELTIAVEQFVLLTKCRRPLPEKWHGLKDVEVRYRKRYLDLIMNPSVMETFLTRARVIKEMRDFLDQRGFVEVETPMMQTIPGGALARPFKTFHNALGMDLYLRIAPELFLKKLIVGGMEKVYEINRSFRNEGVSVRHNPEFTMLELYQAYGNYQTMMELCQAMISSVLQKVKGTFKIKYRGLEIDFTPPWKQLNLREAIWEKGKIDILDDSIEDFKKKAREWGISFEEDWDRGKFVNEFLEKLVQPFLINPTFVLEYPVDISPLAKAKPGDPRLAERFELFMGGEEIGNAYSELNDPLEQRKRFEQQFQKRQKGDIEAHLIDEDYLEALEYGMPPTGGLGIGIDRLIMVITDASSIREVILFPLLRPVNV